MLLTSLAWAADVTVGGAVDAMGGLVMNGDAVGGIASLRQAEGDVQLGDEGLNLRLDLDVSLTWNGEVGLAGVGPEWLAVRGQTQEFRAVAGFFPAPWHGEARDPWMEPLVTLSPTDDVLPRALAGAGGGFGSEKVGLDFLAGLEGPPVELVAPESIRLSGQDAILGLHGFVDTEAVDLGGGFYTLPWRASPFGAQLDVRADIGVVRLFGEGVWGESRFGGQLRGEVWPDGMLTPVARVEYLQGSGPGFAAGISSVWEKIVRAKLEASYRAGTPGVYAEVALFSETAARR